MSVNVCVGAIATEFTVFWFEITVQDHDLVLGLQSQWLRRLLWAKNVFHLWRIDAIVTSIECTDEL